MWEEAFSESDYQADGSNGPLLGRAVQYRLLDLIMFFHGLFRHFITFVSLVKSHKEVIFLIN